MGVGAPWLDIGKGDKPKLTLGIVVREASHDEWRITVQYQDEHFRGFVTATETVGFSTLVALPDILREVAMHWLYGVRPQSLPLRLKQSVREYSGP